MVHIFVDFEMNQVSWKDRGASGPIKNEIIQIGAVKLSEDYRVLSVYEAFVRPMYSTICPICTRLTGIVQTQVSAARTLPDAIEDFLAWVNDAQAKYYSWSDNDSRQLRQELRYKGVEEARITLFDDWADFQKEYCDVVGQSRMGLDIALSGAGLKQIGSKHSAAADALSSVQLLKLIRSPKYFGEGRRENIVRHTRRVRNEQQERRQAVRAKQAQRSQPMKESKPKAHS